MSTAKSRHLLRAYLRELKNLRTKRPIVSAGEFAKHVGISRTTAKKYLNHMVYLGYAVAYDYQHVNGMTCTAYMPAKAGI